MDYSLREGSLTGQNYPPPTTHHRSRPLDRRVPRPRTADESSMSATSWFQKARILPIPTVLPDDDRLNGSPRPSGGNSSQHSRSRDSASYHDISAGPTTHQSAWYRLKKKPKLGSPRVSNKSFDGGIVSVAGSRSSFSAADQPSKLGKRNPNGLVSLDSPPAVPPKLHVETVSTLEVVASRLSMSANPVIEQHNRKGSVPKCGTVAIATTLLQQVDSAIDTSTITSPQPVPSTSIASDFSWQQAKDRMNYLEQELRQAQHEIEHAHNEITQRDQEIVRLGEELNAARQVLPPEIAAYEEQFAAQNALIERLRTKAADSAGMAAETPLGQSRLQMTESRILEAWRELTFEVHNFVRCYLSIEDLGARKMEQWAKARGDKLKEICPGYDRMVLDKAASDWFVEAAIWKVLHGAVFVSSTTHGNACWAGRYQSRLEKLSVALASSIKPSEPDKTRHFHQWKAATASLIYTLGPKATDVQETILDVSDKLEELIDPFRSRLPMVAVRDMLHKIVTKAIAFDETLCGQQSWYYLCYPDFCDNFELDSKLANVAEKECVTGQQAKFVIRPGLSRTGGRRGEGNYAEGQVLDKWLACV
ncbi:uncharacterized protein QC763_704920 [Podospora pseudopauciseta]|uniref:Uncharacterized protein n=1 Tax=Podospora pseudopauciseta TaxID=2093780 RepID=A0ABR0GZS5_9PEZI|nr:hypothetical protein QC763_704920 [Podospora pseudopauciseta]